jgi:hypothetical protein
MTDLDANLTLNFLDHLEKYRKKAPCVCALPGGGSLATNTAVAPSQPSYPGRAITVKGFRSGRRWPVLPAQIISGELNGDPRRPNTTPWNCSRTPMT